MRIIAFLTLNLSAFSAYAATISFDVEIDDFSAPTAIDEVFSYHLTVPDSVADDPSPPASERYDFPLLSLSAAAGGTTTEFLLSELVDPKIRMSSFIGDIGGGIIDESVEILTFLPVPSLSLSSLENQGPLTLNINAFWSSFGGFETVPQLSGNATDFLNVTASMHEVARQGRFFLTDSSGSIVAGDDFLTANNSYLLSITNVVVSVPEPSVSLIVVTSLFGCLFVRRRSGVIATS